MDRLQQLTAAREVAEQIVRDHGDDGDAKARFYELEFSLISASERRQVWHEAAGVDDRTGLPAT